MPCDLIGPEYRFDSERSLPLGGLITVFLTEMTSILSCFLEKELLDNDIYLYRQSIGS